MCRSRHFWSRVTRMSPDKRRFRRERSRMAKKKRSAALFEVMVKQEQARLPRPPGVFRTLYLWFKNRPRGERAPARVASAVAVRGEGVERFGAPVAPRPILREVHDDLPPLPVEPAPSREDPETRMKVARAGGLLSLRVSYGTAMITAFAIATVVISAFLIGKKWQSRPQTVLAAQTTPELRRQAPRPNLTDVRRVST